MKLLKSIYLFTFLLLFGFSNKNTTVIPSLINPTITHNNFSSIQYSPEDLDSVEILKKIVLPKIINETSGLEFYKNNFITHNDSGGKPFLYIFNETGNIVSTINLNKDSTIKVKNNDWEDITMDNEYLFIANTGNNFGYRRNLNIIRVNNKSKFTIDGIIRISYLDQISYFPRFKHKHDAEALLIIDDKIALFTKDRESLNTDLYLIDKDVAGPQKLISKVNYKVNSLITGGDYNADLNLLALVGYSKEMIEPGAAPVFKDGKKFGQFYRNDYQFLIVFDKFDIDNLKNNKFKKYIIPVEQAQIEAIKIIDEKTFWVTSEDEGSGHPTLYKIVVR